MTSLNVIYQPIPTNAIYVGQPQTTLTGEFKHGFCGCCSSCSDCLLAFMFPCCYAFCAAQNVNESFCTALLNCLFYPWCLCCLRGTARGKRTIRGGIIEDACATWCCPCCAVIQIKREFD